MRRTRALAAWSILCVVAALSGAGDARAQEAPSPPDVSIPDLSLPTATPTVRVSGSASIAADFYDHSSSPGGAQQGRRPAQLYRITFAPRIDFGGDFSLPINLDFLTPETNTLTPAVKQPSFGQVLQNPLNTFGLSSITPRLSWAQLYLGSHTPRYSELTAGDQPLFGAGVNLTPAGFIVSASAGATQRAVEPDTALRTAGAYRRDVYMARLGYGREGESMIALNAVYAKDDPSSIRSNVVAIVPAHALVEDTTIVVPADTLRLRAAEGVVASVSGRAVIVDGVDLSGELALSSYTSDVSLPEVEIADNPLKTIIPTRASTRADVGGDVALTVAGDAWGVELSAAYLGAGFVPIGYAFGQADRLELAVAPHLSLFDDALSIRGSIGQRVNNLSSNSGETARHLIASADVVATVSEALSIAARYSNYGIRNDQVGDTLKVRNVSQSLSIDPTLTLALGGAQHLVAASIGLDAYDDYNVVTGALGSNDTRTAMASYTVRLDSIPLTAGLIASYLENRLHDGDLIIRSLGFDASYALFDRLLEPRVSVTFGGSTFSGATDGQLFLRLAVRARLGEHVGITVDLGRNSYEYGDPLPRGASFDESLARLSLSTQF